MTYFLAHHGIKGQQWGVRRGPPYPIEDTTLHKGQKLNSISWYPDSEKYKNRKQWMYTYRPDEEWDNKVYKGPFAVFKRQQMMGMAAIYEHQYEVVKDLKMPTSKERIDEFVKVYSEDPKKAAKDLKVAQKWQKQNQVGTEAARAVNLKKLKTDADYRAAYEVFNHAMEAANAFATTRRYVELMSQKYDAMVDDNNQGVYNKARDPIIVFRADEALKTIGSARMVDVNEIMTNYKEVADELQKQGESILL